MIEALMDAWFPAESVPDGSVLLPHHLTYGALLALLVVLVVWDDYRRREPVAAAAGLGVALFGFALTWPTYPATGAVLTLGGLALATVSPLRPLWRDYPRRWTAAYVLALLVAWDDALSHALGVWTPLDALFHAGVRGMLA